jgi:hypothetical protein
VNHDRSHVALALAAVVVVIVLLPLAENDVPFAPVAAIGCGDTIAFLSIQDAERTWFATSGTPRPYAKMASGHRVERGVLPA